MYRNIKIKAFPPSHFHFFQLTASSSIKNILFSYHLLFITFYNFYNQIIYEIILICSPHVDHRTTVEYLQRHVRPGLEWMVKFSLVVTTMNLGEKMAPEEQLRALFYLVRQSLVRVIKLLLV